MIQAQAKYFAHWLTRSLPSDNIGKLTESLQDAQVDLTPVLEQELCDINAEIKLRKSESKKSHALKRKSVTASDKRTGETPQ